ncbi:MAG: 4-hydroxy-3-methylbut-2-enyl diphosphate reductase [Candidatus Kapaibacterium sp.]
MQVRIDSFSGFCWGVVRTVKIAEQTLEENVKAPVYVLGHIIHNPREITRLEERGLETISVEDFPRLQGRNAKVSIRAHGEPPETYRRAMEFGIEIIDATCPVVTKLQERVRKFYDQGYQVVIFGKKDHAEVIGVRGVCNDECLVVLTVEEAATTVDMSRKTVLFSQTTMDRATFLAIKEFLQQRVLDLVVDEMREIAVEFHAKDTICGQVSGREDQLVEFARDNDVIVFVAGRASSNGKVLYNGAKTANPNTYFVEDSNEIRPEWFAGARTVGISGATSTPHWHMKEVQSFIERQTVTGH